MTVRGRDTADAADERADFLALLDLGLNPVVALCGEYFDQPQTTTQGALP